MKKENNIWPIIVRHLDQTFDDSDSKKLEKWLDQREENRRILQSAEKIWKSSEGMSHDYLMNELNLEKDWELIKKQITSSNLKEKRERIYHFRKLRKRQQLFSNLLKVAVLLVVAVSSGLITLQIADKPEQIITVPVFNEIATNPGERASVELGDGSKVILNAASKLILPDSFSAQKREITLNGQAFFDVKSDRNRSFNIQTDIALVQVLGTSFDVRSYENEDKIYVAVSEGTVELSHQNQIGSSLIINEGYIGSISKSTGQLTLEMFEDPDLYFGWMDGRIIFKNAPLEDVFNHLERWYAVSIDYDKSNNDLMMQRFTADLKTRSIREVFGVLSLSMDIDFQIRDEDQIFVYFNNNTNDENS
tara:strand:- start:92206 stop:93294 length:1089 start_codon:yes stop_codon:yes gene_type:complete